MLLLLVLLTFGTKTGTATPFTAFKSGGTRGGFAGDSRGIRWGFAGDSQAIRGIRLKNACFWFEFQGDSLETTNPFYNIK